MLPSGSVSIKGYATQTPFTQKTLPEGQRLSYVDFDINRSSSIATIQFVLKDEDTGTWYKDNEKNFRVILEQAMQNDFCKQNNHVGSNIWPGLLDQLSGLFLKSKVSSPQALGNESDIDDSNHSSDGSNGVCKEYKLSKETVVENSLKVSVRKNKEKKKKLVCFETDLPGDVVLHWGVCKDSAKRWEIPVQGEYPSNTNVFKRRALQTTLQRKDDGTGNWAVLCLDEDYKGLLFVLKLKGNNTWLKNKGDDYYIPLTMESSWFVQSSTGYTFPQADSAVLDWTLKEQLELEKKKDDLDKRRLLSSSDSESSKETMSSAEGQTSLLEAKEKMDEKQVGADDGKMEKMTDESQQLQGVEYEQQSINVDSNPIEIENNYFPEKEIASSGYKDAASILLNKEIKILVERISAESSGSVESTTRENLLQEIERLAAIAYSSFIDSPVLTEEPEPAVKVWKPEGKPCSGTGSGKEVLLQGFNWESHHSGRWYHELAEKVDKIASWGFTVVWLPPPTDSVSPEGYMPRDLYNLNSRYGSMDDLKNVVKCFHNAGVKVLGDVVLNHRCAQYQNHNGIWNIFGGRLNWDDRAVVCDDPHFQGRGNRSSGDFFHAAPNIDHSQEFVRRDINDWLRWLRQEIGYDGWRLDFVRGFWGGYVKDYLQGSEPYFAVGEYWDSLSYTYGQMDYNQDGHRQRIIDWINATGGNAGAFDVTTKGILHTALEKCEYWRLSDKKGAPPGVVGWWPSRAVTFIENHDTGSTQGHWRFPAGKEIQGYAYILTHPGTPSVFYDHLFSHNCDGIAALVALRKRARIHCRSVVCVEKADRDVYAAKIDDRVLMKIGPGHYQPPSGSKKWILATEGQNYKVWEAL
uniref:Alpha-amylase n=1 Tax=Araucaria cunninghamii TaxID=56994 RepID=A0A0D6R490_ARACU